MKEITKEKEDLLLFHKHLEVMNMKISKTKLKRGKETTSEIKQCLLFSMCEDLISIHNGNTVTGIWTKAMQRQLTEQKIPLANKHRKIIQSGVIKEIKREMTKKDVFLQNWRNVSGVRVSVGDKEDIS